jgi:hypothetical protein
MKGGVLLLKLKDEMLRRSSVSPALADLGIMRLNG